MARWGWLTLLALVLVTPIVLAAKRPTVAALVIGFAVFSGIPHLITISLIALLPLVEVAVLRHELPRTRAVLLGIGFVTVAVLSLTWTPDLGGGTDKVVQTAKGVLLLFLVQWLFPEQRHVVALMIGAIGGALRFAMLGALAPILGLPTFNDAVRTPTGGYLPEPRPFLAGYDPNYTAVSWSFLFVFLVATGSQSTDRRLRWLSFMGAALIGTGILITGSRGGLLGALAGVLALFVLRRGMHFRQIVRMAGLVGVSLIVVATMFPGILDRYPGRLETAYGRISTWRTAANAFLSHPLGGMGANGFAHSQPATSGVREAHNTELEVLADYGLLGGFLFFPLLLTPFKRGPRWTKAAWVGILVGTAGLSASSHAFMWVSLAVATHPAWAKRKIGESDSLDSRPHPMYALE